MNVFGLVAVCDPVRCQGGQGWTGTTGGRLLHLQSIVPRVWLERVGRKPIYASKILIYALRVVVKYSQYSSLNFTYTNSSLVGPSLSQ